jgi:hypothetical protein
MPLYPPQNVCLEFPYLRYTAQLLKTARILKKNFTVAPVGKKISVFLAKPQGRSVC